MGGISSVISYLPHSYELRGMANRCGHVTSDTGGACALLLCTIFVLFMPATAAAQTAYYVNDGVIGEVGGICTAVGNDANDGLAPGTPMRTIQGLLDKYPAIGAGKTLWIDAGTYPGNINIVATHAGLKFQGVGPDKTIIDGGQLNSVIVATNFGAGEISGMTIQNGKASGATALEKSGGGIRLNGASTAVITNCIIRNNAAGSGSGGGAIYTYNASPTITNCLLYGNTGTGNGGIRTYGGTVAITNCTVADNTPSGIHKTGTGTLTITNCIVWGNGDDLLSCTATYSCIEDGDVGTGNTAANPQFVNGAWGNYHLKLTSPCIDAANGSVAPISDMDGNGRRDEPTVADTGLGTPPADMGAYEFHTLVYSDLFVNDSTFTESGSRCSAEGHDANDGLSPSTPKRSIQSTLNAYPNAGAGKALWIDPGLYVENVSTAVTNAGLKIRGAGAGRSIVDGNQANSVFVLSAFGAGELRGLTIQNGKASGATALEKSGGGIRIVSASSALIADCIIRSNAAGSGSGGGGIYTYIAAPIITNCVVYGNTGSGNGGIRTYGGDVTITNCTVANNGVSGISKTGTGTLTIKNCIVWGNGDDLMSCAATYSCIEDGDAGTGNTAGNPLFANAAAGDYHLISGSPCIDAADGSVAPALDIEGNARRDDPDAPNVGIGPRWADMGAYEFYSNPVTTTTTLPVTTTLATTTTTTLGSTTTTKATTTTTLAATTTTTKAPTTTTTGSTTTTTIPKSTIWATGANGVGQLGLGNTVGRNTFAQVVAPVDVVALSSAYSAPASVGGVTYSQVSASWAITADGNAWACGLLGNGAATQSFAVASGLGNIRSISGSLVLCWDGAVSFRRYTTTGASWVSVPITGVRKLSAIGHGVGVGTVACDINGAVWVSGSYPYQLGLGDTHAREKYTKVPDVADVVEVAIAEYSHTMLLKSDGTVWVTGSNGSGQLGLGDPTFAYRGVFVQIPNLLGVTAIAIGFDYSLVLKSDGTVWGCGCNVDGQLGMGDNYSRATFTKIPNISNVSRIAANPSRQFNENPTTYSNVSYQNHVLLIKNDGTLWACGGNAQGQLGLGDNVDRNTFTQVPGISNAVAGIAAPGYSLILRRTTP